MNTGNPWPEPAAPQAAQKVAQALLESLQEALPDMDLAQHRAFVEREVAPWLALELDDPAHFEAELEDITVVITDELQQFGDDQARDILREHAVAARVNAADRWIKQAVRAVARQEQPRQSFTSAAAALDEDLNSWDDALRAQSPQVRAAFSDQLSEMYLDLEFLRSGVSGSLRHAHLLDAQEETS